MIRTISKAAPYGLWGLLWTWKMVFCPHHLGLSMVTYPTPSAYESSHKRFPMQFVKTRRGHASFFLSCFWWNKQRRSSIWVLADNSWSILHNFRRIGVLPQDNFSSSWVMRHFSESSWFAWGKFLLIFDGFGTFQNGISIEVFRFEHFSVSFLGLASACPSTSAFRKHCKRSIHR